MEVDRERVLSILRQRCGDGVISLEEFGDRAGLVFAADVREDLDTALGDTSWRTIPAIVPGRVLRAFHAAAPQDALARRPLR